MAVVISMLRGVNVGGHNKIKMEALRSLYESLKLRDARTYVQSGNVIFRADERNLVSLASRVENAISGTSAFVRTSLFAPPPNCETQLRETRSRRGAASIRASSWSSSWPGIPVRKHETRF